MLRALLAVGVDQMMLAFGGFVRIDALGDGVAVDAERLSGIRDALLVADKSLLNVELFELLEGFIQENLAIEHVFNDSF